MEVYREVHALSTPPELVARAVAGDRETATGDSAHATGPGGGSTREHDGGSSQERDSGSTGERDGGSREERDGGRWGWTDSRGGGLVRYEFTLDPAAGTAETVVRVPGAVRWLSLSALLVVPGAVLAGVTPGVYLLLMWVYAALALLPTLHLWPGIGRRPDFGAFGTAVRRRVAVTPLAAYAGAIGCQWAALRPGRPALVVDVLSLVLLAIGVGVFYAGNAFGGPDDAEPAVTALGIPLSGLVPALFTTGNLLLAGALVAAETTTLADIALVATVALAVDAVFFAYCRVVLDSFRDARLRTLRSLPSRVAGLGLYLGVNAVLLAALLVALSVLGTWIAPGVVPEVTLPIVGNPLPGRLLAVLAPLPGPARAYAVVLAAVLTLPLLVTAGMWAVDTATGIAARYVVVSRSRPVDATVPTLSSVEVRVVDHDRPFVRPVSLFLGRQRYVLLSRPVLETLDAAELAAVLAHEASHLREPDLVAGAAATLAAVALGGRNSLLAFYDLPAAERAADEFAADHAGVDPFVRALRRLEDRRYRAVTGGGPLPVLAPGGGEGTLRATLLAPYRLFFGSLLFERAHRSVDERIAHLVGRTRSETRDDGIDRA